MLRKEMLTGRNQPRHEGDGNVHRATPLPAEEPGSAHPNRGPKPGHCRGGPLEGPDTGDGIATIFSVH